MSGNTTLQKYANRFGEGIESAGESDAEGTENLGAFGFLRGSRDRAEMLELRKKTGNLRAIGFGWIQKIDFDPSSGITLYVVDETIKIKGRNLNAIARQQISLLGGIIRHRVPWIAESDQSTILQADKSDVVVETIEW
ncbi:MAG TPA: hypothetical protein VGG19_14205 [Tepidisphaeraceae bacterium]|jgi:hypothetical protein